MAYAHSFTDVLPPARYDDPAVPWTSVLIEQATSPSGTWTEIDVQDVDPDPSPQTPNPIDITVISEIESAWFRFRFVDDDDVLSSYSPAVKSPSDEELGVRASLADIGALMHARTNVMGSEIGTFTDQTKPTGVQVEDLITRSDSEVRARIGQVPPVALYPAVRSLIALRTAMLIEASYFPESSDDAYQRFRELYQDLLTDLTLSLSGTEPGANTMLASIPITTIPASVSPYIGNELLP